MKYKTKNYKFIDGRYVRQETKEEAAERREAFILDEMLNGTKRYRRAQRNERIKQCFIEILVAILLLIGVVILGQRYTW